MRSYDPRIIKALMKTMYLGLFLNTMGPIVIMVLLVVVRGDSFNMQGRMSLPEDGAMRSLLYVAIALSIIIILITYFMRKKLLESSVCPEGTAKLQYFNDRVIVIARVVYLLNAIHTVFGLVLYSVGFPLEIMMLFTAGTLISYQFFRPRPRVLEEFFERVTGERLE
ncbi:MAG: hypothetical protein R3F48_05105 [Candidatus Zixiibacteriota bacterium]